MIVEIDLTGRNEPDPRNWFQTDWTTIHPHPDLLNWLAAHCHGWYHPAFAVERRSFGEDEQWIWGIRGYIIEFERDDDAGRFARHWT
jgi:hypothetical protein